MILNQPQYCCGISIQSFFFPSHVGKCDAVLNSKCKYFCSIHLLSLCVSDWVWVKETWNINFHSEVALERQVNFLNQSGEGWNWENAFKEKCLGLTLLQQLWGNRLRSKPAAKVS